MRFLQHRYAFVLTAALLLVAMTALEYLYFRRLSGGIPGFDMRFAGFSDEDVTKWLMGSARDRPRPSRQKRLRSSL